MSDHLYTNILSVGSILISPNKTYNLQVLNYVQALWSSIDPTKQNVYNGVVEGTATLFGKRSVNMCLFITFNIK